MVPSESLMVIPPSLGRCQACEGPLIPKLDTQHIEPAKMCPTAGCSLMGVCLTCQMLRDWFTRADEDL